MTGCHGMECLHIEAKIICAEKIEMYLITTKVDGSKLQIGAKSMYIVTIQFIFQCKHSFFNELLLSNIYLIKVIHMFNAYITSILTKKIECIFIHYSKC